MTSSNPIPARRGSLVGPLILLLLGALFLASNLRPDLSVWRLFARYWPFLLIFWGVGRLVEYAIARAGSRLLPRTLTGGEVFLAILLSIFGHGMFVSERGDWGIMRWGNRGLDVLGESYNFPIDARRPAPPRSEIIIDNPQGNIHVTGIESNEIKVGGQKSIQALDRAAAEEADKQSAIDITEQGSQIHVRTGQGSASGSRRVSTNLEITVPKDARLRLDGRNGDLNVKDVSGAVDLTGANAAVYLENIGGDVRVEVRRSDLVRAQQVKGGVHIEGRGRDIELENIVGAVDINGEFSGGIRLGNLAKPLRYASSRTNLRLERLAGKLDMDLGSLHATDVTGPFHVETQSKDIRLEGFSQEVEVTTHRGDIDLRDPRLPLAAIRATTQNGDIALALPDNAVFFIQAETTHGAVNDDFGGSVRIQQQGRGARMQGGTAAPGSGAQIRLSSSRGTINLSKASHVQSQ